MNLTFSIKPVQNTKKKWY